MIEEAVNLYLSGLSRHKVGVQLGISEWKVSAFLRSAGVQARSKTCAWTAWSKARAAPINHNALSTLTPEVARVVGWILADGCIMASTLAINLKKEDRDVLTSIAKILGFEGRIYSHTAVLNEKSYPQEILRLSSKGITDSLRGYGVTERKSLRETYPEVIQSAGEDINRMFIRGVFEGDGTVTKYKHSKQKHQLVFQLVGTKALLSGVLDQLRRFVGHAIGGSLSANGRRSVDHYALRLVGNRQARAVLDWIYAGGGPHMIRKHDRFRYLIEEIG